VLDDVHVLRARRCLEQLGELVAHPPQRLRLVLGSRSDPVLPLHLPRLHGSLTEIRARELAFSPPEAQELLLAHGLELGAELAETLCRRTEGWAAGLRLAALSLQRQPDPERFVAEFAGDDRVVADYLLAEVLHGERPRRRRFLLQTAIADRLCGGLADAITGEHDGAVTLEALERDNGFVVALDTQRRWYRMHRLFGELLRVHARRELGDELRELHRRAARWYDAAGEPADALRHAAAGADWELTAELAATHWLELSARSGAQSLRATLALLPPERREADPRIAAVLACLEFEAGETREAERHLARAASDVDWPRHLDTLAIARLRAAPDRAHELAGALFDDSGGRDRWGRELRHAIAHRELGVAGLWTASRATDHLGEAVALGRAHDFEGLALSALGHLALAQALRAGPAAARELAREALECGRSGTADAAPGHLAAGVVALLERRLDDAEAFLAGARDALSGGENACLAATLELVAAELDAARGDPDSALRRVDALSLREASGPLRALAAALRARVLAEQLGDGAGARAALSRAPRDAATAELAVAAARVHLAGGDPASALPVLERARGAEPLLAVTRVEAAMLQAVALEQLHDPSAADAALEDALLLADASGHRGVFLAAGRMVEPLLRRRIRHGTACRGLVCELLHATQPPVRASAPLLQALSVREQMILRYLPTPLSNREIASELFVTTNTVKTHLRSIYRKLGVAGRREAVERARALRLVAR
jgi:LuxR family maltose regulon positive regulatory protein